MKPEAYSRDERELAGWPVTVETYALDGVYHCTIANVDPGARISRADGRDARRGRAEGDREGDAVSGEDPEVPDG